MTDPLGLIGSQQINPAMTGQARARQSDPSQPDFTKFLKEQLAEVNEAQRDAKEAVEDLSTGRRDDLEGVIVATQKADTAFRMLLAVRNKVMDAYQEVKDIRV